MIPSITTYSSYLNDFNSFFPSVDNDVRDEMWSLFLNKFGTVVNGTLVPPDLATFQSFLANRELANAPSSYSTAISNTWPTLTAPQQQELWQEFLDHENLILNPSSSDSVSKGLFDTYLASKQLSDAPEAFTAIFTAHFGSSISASAMQAYWAAFLQANSYPANPPDDPQFTTDPHTTAFATYITSGSSSLSNATGFSTNPTLLKVASALASISGVTQANVQSMEGTLWAGFLAKYSYPSNPPDDPSIEALFANFLTDKTLPASPNRFAVALQSTIATIDPTLSTAEQQSIWNSFLQTEGLLGTPPDTSDANAILTAFTAYLSSFASSYATLTNPANAPYFNAMSAVFGSSLTPTQETLLLQNYLAARSLTTIPIFTPNPENLVNSANTTFGIFISAGLGISNNGPNSPSGFENGQTPNYSLLPQPFSNNFLASMVGAFGFGFNPTFSTAISLPLAQSPFNPTSGWQTFLINDFTSYITTTSNISDSNAQSFLNALTQATSNVQLTPSSTFTLSSTEEQAVWQAFLTSQGYPLNPPAEAGIVSNFTNALKTLIPSQSYVNYIQSLYPQQQLSGDQIEALWLAFLASPSAVSAGYGVATPPSLTSTVPTLPQNSGIASFAQGTQAIPAQFQAILTTAFGSVLNQSFINSFWQQFLVSQNLTGTSDPLFPSTTTTFQNYVNSSPSTLTNAPAYQAILLASSWNTLLPTLTGGNQTNVQQAEQDLWAAFLAKQGYPFNPPADPTVEAQFTAFLTSSPTTLPQPPNQYGTLIQNSFGPEITTATKQAIWNDFISVYKFPTNPPETSWIINTLFIPFIASRSIASSVNAPYLQAITALFGSSLTYVQEQELWQNYLLANGLTTPQDTSPTSANVTRFQQFINTTDISSPQAQAFLNAFPPTPLLTLALKQQIWQAFLTSSNYAANPPPDPAIVGLFQNALSVLIPSSAYRTYIQSLYSPNLTLTNDQLETLWLGFLATIENPPGTLPVQIPAAPLEDSALTTYIQNIQQIPAAFLTLLTNAFGPSFSQPSINTYWAKFLTAEDLPSDPPATTQYLTLFQNYINGIEGTSKLITPYYQTTLTSIWGSTLTSLSNGNTANVTQAENDLWSAFITAQGYPSSPPDDSGINSAFTSFLTNTTLPSAPNQYVALFQSVFGNTITLQQEQQMWAAFISQYSLPGNPPETSWILNSVFLPFLNVQYMNSITSAINAPYLKEINDLWGSTLTATQKQTLWTSYLQTNNITTPQQADPTTANLASFELFLTTGTTILSPQNQNYLAAINSAVQSIMPTLSSAGKQAIWTAFLASQGYPANASPPFDPQILNALVALLPTLVAPSGYQTYIQSLYPNTTLTADQIETLWLGFLSSIGSPPATVPASPADNSQILAYITSIKAIPSQFSTILTQDFGASLSSISMQTYWAQYLTARGFLSASQATTSDFTSYIASASKLLTQTSGYSANASLAPWAAAFTALPGSTQSTIAQAKQDLWTAFLTVQGYPSNPPDDPSIEALFTSYLTGTNTTLPQPPNQYGSLFQSTFGSSLTTQQEQTIWNTFLSHYGFPANPPVSASIVSALTTFLNGQSITSTENAPYLQALISALNAIGLTPTASQEQTIWQNFLTTNGYLFPPDPTVSANIQNFQQFATPTSIFNPNATAFLAVYQTTNNINLFGSASLQQIVWQNYLTAHGYTANPPATPSNVSSFSSYVTSLLLPSSYKDQLYQFFGSTLPLGNQTTQPMLEAMWIGFLSSPTGNGNIVNQNQFTQFLDYIGFSNPTLYTNSSPPRNSFGTNQSQYINVILNSGWGSSLSVSDQELLWSSYLMSIDRTIATPGWTTVFDPPAASVSGFQAFIQSTSITSPLAAPFLAAFNSPTPATTKAAQAAIWKEFLINNNYPADPPPNATNIAAFQSYVTSVVISPPTITSITDIGASAFLALFNANASFITSSSLIQSIWQQFLTARGYTTNPPPTSANLADFTSYLNSVLSISDPVNAAYLQKFTTVYGATPPTSDQEQAFWTSYLETNPSSIAPTSGNLSQFQSFITITSIQDPSASDFLAVLENLPSPITTPELQNVIWKKFLTAKGFTTNPAATQSNITLFQNYVNYNPFPNFSNFDWLIDAPSTFGPLFPTYVPFLIPSSIEGQIPSYSSDQIQAMWLGFIASTMSTNFNTTGILNEFSQYVVNSNPPFTSNGSPAGPYVNVSGSTSTLWSYYLFSIDRSLPVTNFNPANGYFIPPAASVSGFTAFIQTTSISAPQAADFLAAFNDPDNTTTSLATKQSIWQSYLSSKGFTYDPSPTGALITDFTNFLANAIVSPQNSALIVQQYGPATTLTGDQIESIWLGFLGQNTYSTLYSYITNGLLAFSPALNSAAVSALENVSGLSFISSAEQSVIQPAWSNFLLTHDLASTVSYSIQNPGAFSPAFTAVWESYIANGLNTTLTSVEQGYTDTVSQIWGSALAALPGSTPASIAIAEQQLFGSYMTISNLLAALPGHESAFASYLTTNTLSTASSTYTSIFQSAYASGVTAAQRQTIWSEFLTANALPGNPPASPWIASLLTTFLNTRSITATANLPYLNAINAQWGSIITPSEKEELWQGYLVANNFVAPPDPTVSANVTAFTTYLSGLGSSITAPNAAAFQAVFGTMSPPLLVITSTGLKQDIWTRFLSAKGYPENPPPDSAIITDFTNYLTAVLTITTVPGNPYSTLNSQYLSTLTATWSGLTTTQEQTLWTSYLQTNPATAPTSTNLTAFQTYVNSAHNSITDPNVAAFKAVFSSNAVSFQITSSALQQNIWGRFLTAQGLTGNPAATQNNINAFTAYLQSVLSITDPINTPYANEFTSVWGASVFTDPQKQSVWTNYLTQVTPPSTTDPTAGNLAAFATFIRQASTSITDPAAAGFLDTLTQKAAGLNLSLSASTKQAVWQAFLASQSYPGNPPDNTTTENYLKDALKVLLPPTNYQAFIDTTLGITLTGDQMESLWLNFLSTPAASSYAISIPPATTPTLPPTNLVGTYIQGFSTAPQSFLQDVASVFTGMGLASPSQAVLQKFWTPFLISTNFSQSLTSPDPNAVTNYVTSQLDLTQMPSGYATTISKIWGNALTELHAPVTPQEALLIQQEEQDLWAGFIAVHGPVDTSPAAVSIATSPGSPLIQFLTGTTLPPPSDQYATDLQTVLGSQLTSEEMQAIWTGFLTANALPGNPPDYIQGQTATILNLFTAYLNNRSIIHNSVYNPYLQVLAASPVGASLPAGQAGIDEEEAIWQNYLISVVGAPISTADFQTFLSATGITAAQNIPFRDLLIQNSILPITTPAVQQTLWQEFLTSQGFAPTVNPPADSATLSAFSTFLTTVLAPAADQTTITSVYGYQAHLTSDQIEEVWLGFLASPDGTQYGGVNPNVPGSVSQSTVNGELTHYITITVGTTIPAGYLKIINSIYGSLLTTGSSGTQNTLWQEFLANPNSVSPDLITQSYTYSPPDNDPAITAQLTAFLTQNSIASPEVADFYEPFAQFSDPQGLLTPAIRQQIWVNFLNQLSPPFVSGITGQPINPPDTPDLVAAFNAYLTNSATPTTGPYFTLLQNTLTPDVVTALSHTSALSSVWQSIISSYHLPYALPTVSTSTPPDPTTTTDIAAIISALTTRMEQRSLSLRSNFQNAVTNFFGSAIQSATQQGVLWQNFLISQNLSVDPLNNDQGSLNAWTTYLNNSLLTNADQQYRTAIDNSFAGLIASTAQKQALWQNFLTTYSYVNNQSVDGSNLTTFLANRTFSSADPQFQATVAAVLGKAATPDMEALVWQGWLTSHEGDFAINPTYSAAMNSDLSSYLQSTLLTNADPHYQGIVNAQLGNTFTGAEQQEVWFSWLSSQGLASNPPYVSSTDPTTAAYVSSLLSYVTAIASQSSFPTHPPLDQSIIDAFTQGIANATTTGGSPTETLSYAPLIPSNTALTQTIWTAFMATQDPTAPITTATATAFQAFLQARLPTGFYISTLQTLDRTATGQIKTPDEQLADWEQFLTTQGFTAAPAQSIDAEKQFVTYLQNRFVNAQHTGTFSPLEIQKRQIMFLVFELAQKMLKILEDTVAVQANNLIFLGKWQQQYTTMMTSVPIYTSTPTNVWEPNTTDATKFTLGYSNITVDDISQYLASKALPTTVGITATTFNLTAYTNDPTGQNAAGLAGNLNFDTPMSDYIHFNPASVTVNGTTTYGTITAINTTVANDSTLQGILTYYANGVPGTDHVNLLYSNLHQAQTRYTADTGTSNPTLAALLNTISSASLNSSGIQDITLNNNPTSGLATYIYGGTTASALAKLSSAVTTALGGGDTVNVGILATDSATVQQQKWDTAFLSLYNNTSGNPAMSLIKTGGTLPTDNIAAGAVIPWQQNLLNPYPSNDADPNAVQPNSTASTNRAQENAKLQQNVENIRAQRDIVGNSMQTMQTNITQTQQALSKQSDLLTSIIQTLQTIASSIAR